MNPPQETMLTPELAALLLSKPHPKRRSERTLLVNTPAASRKVVGSWSRTRSWLTPMD